MTKIQLDASMQAKLGSLTEPLELCDSTGQTLGQFLPKDVYYRLLMSLPESQISSEELDARFNEPGGRSLAEIWARLGVEPS